MLSDLDTLRGFLARTMDETADNMAVAEKVDQWWRRGHGRALSDVSLVLAQWLHDGRNDRAVRMMEVMAHGREVFGMGGSYVVFWSSVLHQTLGTRNNALAQLVARHLSDIFDACGGCSLPNGLCELRDITARHLRQSEWMDGATKKSLVAMVYHPHLWALLAPHGLGVSVVRDAVYLPMNICAKTLRGVLAGGAIPIEEIEEACALCLNNAFATGTDHGPLVAQLAAHHSSAAQKIFEDATTHMIDLLFDPVRTERFGTMVVAMNKLFPQHTHKLSTLERFALIAPNVVILSDNIKDIEMFVPEEMDGVVVTLSQRWLQNIDPLLLHNHTHALAEVWRTIPQWNLYCPLSAAQHSKQILEQHVDVGGVGSRKKI